MHNNNETVPNFLDTVRWPIIVAALLLGHTTLMLIIFTFAHANPPRLVEGSPYAAAPEEVETSLETYEAGK